MIWPLVNACAASVVCSVLWLTSAASDAVPPIPMYDSAVAAPSDEDNPTVAVIAAWCPT